MTVHIFKDRRYKGFALVVTVSLLVLLSVLALGMLSLSAVTLRASSQEMAHAKAQANARLALMHAIGELQKQLGPDQRISAPSDIVDPNPVRNPRWTGVWDSWIAGTVNPETVNPNYPNKEIVSAHQTIGDQADAVMRPDYAQKYNHFRSWLLSLNPGEAENLSSPQTLTIDGKYMPTESDTAVKLVGEGSLGPASADAEKLRQHVSVRLLGIQDSQSGEPTGRYGWWVGDESLKARVMNDSYGDEKALTRTDKIYRSQAPGSTGTKTVKGLETITNDSQLAQLPSLKTIDLITGSTGRPAQQNFHDVSHCSSSVLSDVREGGLKRDLSTLLERRISISPEESGDEFMLYRFNDYNQVQYRVPIQDLAAYYQLYYNDPTWAEGRRGGINYNRNLNTFEIKSPDYGDANRRQRHLREYTSLYTSPVPVRIQFILAMGAVPITDQERITHSINPIDTHKMILGVIPVLSLWNPNNVPLVVEQGKGLMFKFSAPPFVLGWKMKRGANDIKNGYLNLNYALSMEPTADGRAQNSNPYVMQFKFGETRSVRFEPGEVKIFSFPSTSARTFKSGLDDQTLLSAVNEYEPRNTWDPFSVFVCQSAATIGPQSVIFSGNRRRMVFNANDTFNVYIATEGANIPPYTVEGGFPSSGQAFFVSLRSEIYGAGFNCWMAGLNHGLRSNPNTYHFRNYQFLSKFGNGNANTPYREFNRDLFMQGFPNGKCVIPFLPDFEALPGSQIIYSTTSSNEVMSFLVFTLGAGCETNSKYVGGYGAGRKTASRPFLHGATIAAPLIDKFDKSALYDYAWEWQVDRINSIEEAIQMNPGTGNTFHGGGYTMEAGTTHVVQQNLPVLPPISIAALSSAHLGGYSLANQPVVAQGSDNIPFKGFVTASGDKLRDSTDPKAFSVVTATGAAGLAPRMMQAIGNSYAHPNLPADKAVSMTYTRQMNHEHPAVQIPYADHSYLANKALWDEFFFSSMVAQSATKVPLYENERSLATVAQEFFFGASNKLMVPLPNRRMIPYGADQEEINDLLTKADQYKDGLADRIASHLMVEGAFNVNSTSVEAWKVLLSSLKGKPVARLDQSTLSEHAAEGVTVNGGILGNANPVKSSQITKFNEPPEQWQAGRELSDSEIEELAKAIVVQVKRRGPFLSLSEFINRRLESGSPLAVKGALQAALDDPSVSINANFRTKTRILDGETVLPNGTPAIPFAHPEAAKGPIAYGSAAYVDQADILGNFAEQLTARGDTFVIRSYGDALDGNGKVIARAWCEAVVQRVPEYVNSADDPHLKQADSTLSEASRKFGRKIQIISFRWLNPQEV